MWLEFYFFFLIWGDSRDGPMDCDLCACGIKRLDGSCKVVLHFV